MESKRIKELALQAAIIRRKALEAIQAANSGHVGGSFSAVDILTVLYFEKMNIDPQNPSKEDRDRFILSKGHCTPAMYATLALRGFFPVEDLSTFRNIDSYLSGHTEMTHIPGVDMSTGSLGQGLSAAAGMALFAKVYKEDYRVFCMVGDGEFRRDKSGEAAWRWKLSFDNLTVFVDNIIFRIDGTIEEVNVSLSYRR